MKIMAHFKGTVQGYRESLSTIGNKFTGLNIKVDGWKSGMSVKAFFNKETGKNVFEIYRTGGRLGSDKYMLVSRITEDDISKPSSTPTAKAEVTRTPKQKKQRRKRRSSVQVMTDKLEALKKQEKELEEQLANTPVKTVVAAGVGGEQG